MSLEHTPARVKLLHACDQWNSSRPVTFLLVATVNHATTLKAKLAQVQVQYDNVSNAAYNVGPFASYSAVQSGTGCKPARASRMFAEVAKMNLELLIQELIQTGDSKKTFDTLVNIARIGKFIGYQICIDLGYYSKRLYGALLPIAPLATNMGWLVQGG
jgi:hypothetical protein